MALEQTLFGQRLDSICGNFNVAPHSACFESELLAPGVAGSLGRNKPGCGWVFGPRMSSAGSQ